MQETVTLVIVGILVIAIAVSLILLSVKEKRALREKGFSSAEEQNEDIYKKAISFADPEEQTMTAEVVNLFCKVDSIGYRPPKTVKLFTVVFKKENGECFELRVDEEEYSAFEVGQCGTLTLLDGALNSFVLD